MYIQPPPPIFRPIILLKGNPLPKLHPSTIPADYRKDKSEKLLNFLSEVEWHIKLIRGEFNHDHQNL